MGVGVDVISWSLREPINTTKAIPVTMIVMFAQLMGSNFILWVV